MDGKTKLKIICSLRQCHTKIQNSNTSIIRFNDLSQMFTAEITVACLGSAK